LTADLYMRQAAVIRIAGEYTKRGIIRWDAKEGCPLPNLLLVR